MSVIIEFEGFSPPKPEGRILNFWRQLVPQKARERDTKGTQDVRRIVNCWQEILDLLAYDIDRLDQLIDPDKAVIEVIDLMLEDMGNPFDWAELELTENQRKKLLRYLVSIYKLKGTAIGIESVVFFLLGKQITVVPYNQEGWTLGEDTLGEADIAEVVSPFIETFDFSSETFPMDMSMIVDEEVEQIMNLTSGDVANDAAVTVNEIILAVNAQIDGATAHKIQAGTHAQIVTDAGTFNLGANEFLNLDIGGHVFEIEFRPEDIENPGFATAAEVAAIINMALYGVGAAVTYEITGSPGIRVRIFTHQRGTGTTISVTGGSAAVELGIVGASGTGIDGFNLAIYSDTPGINASMEITGGTLARGVGWESAMDGVASGTGSAILGPSDSFSLYSFDIETSDVLTSEEEDIIRKIVDYMKVGHEHLIDVREEEEIVFPPGWVLGESELGVDTDLYE